MVITGTLRAYILKLPLAALSKWSLLLEALVNLLVSLLGWYLFQSLVKHLLGDSGRLDILFPTVLASLYCSLANTSNLLWTWQMAVHLTT